MKQQNFKTVEELEGAMRSQNIDPQEMREMWRKQLTAERVMAYEVDRNIYFGLKSKELKDYFEANKTKFTKPETLSMSEIYLSFAARDPDAVREKAKDLVKQLRAGADFVKLVTEHSDRPDAAKTKGKTETIPYRDMDPKFAVPLKDVKAGGVTDPIELDGGIMILRVDERSAASDVPEFNENAVRLAITNERRPDAAKKFMSKLRENAYIRVSESYRPIVSPLLFAEERKAKPGE
jgi:parvulin-like peptidyl-prolyl isomerase